MLSWLLLWPALVTCAAASCYLPSGLEADEEWAPCNKVDGFSICCQNGDTCLDSGLRLTASSIRTGACQNADWVGCHRDIPDTMKVELKARQIVTENLNTADGGGGGGAQTTIVTVGGGGPMSTVVVIATATQTQAVTSELTNPTDKLTTATAAGTAATAPATAEPTTKSSHSKTNLAAIIGGAAGGATVLACIAGIIFYYYRRKQRMRRLNAEIRASIQSDWLGQVEVGSGKKPPEQPEVAEIPPDPRKPHPPHASAGGKAVAEVDGVDAAVVEIDDGRRLDVPVEMESPPPPSQPRWAPPKGVYEIG